MRGYVATACLRVPCAGSDPAPSGDRDRGWCDRGVARDRPPEPRAGTDRPDGSAGPVWLPQCLEAGARTPPASLCCTVGPDSPTRKIVRWLDVQDLHVVTRREHAYRSVGQPASGRGAYHCVRASSCELQPEPRNRTETDGTDDRPGSLQDHPAHANSVLSRSIWLPQIPKTSDFRGCLCTPRRAITHAQAVHGASVAHR